MAFAIVMIENDIKRLICLNIWGGYVKEPLLNFIKSNHEVDIFCLQEVYSNSTHVRPQTNSSINIDIFEQLKKMLPNHNGYFRLVHSESPGIAVFLKRNIEVTKMGHISIFPNLTHSEYGSNHPRDLQWLECSIKGKIFTLMNVHGLWNGMKKNDSKERLIQSRKIKRFMNNIITPKIICGDFNLRPDTISIKIIERDMSNLIQIYNIKSTRTKLHTNTEKYSDYIFTSPEINTISFEVLNDVISDHVPLSLTFSID